MSFFSGFAIYFIIWWITLFLVLPFGVRSQAEEGSVIRGTEPGAPVNAHLGAKLIANSLLAGLVFAAWYIATAQFGFSFASLYSFLPSKP